MDICALVRLQQYLILHVFKHFGTLVIVCVVSLHTVTYMLQPGILHLNGLFVQGIDIAHLLEVLKSGPEPLEKESHEFLGSERNDRLSNPFLKWYQKYVKVRFSYRLCHDNFCKGPWTLRKFPQKCQKIAGC